MADYLTTEGHTQVIIPLIITPFSHQALPTVAGNLFSDEAGAVLIGHYKMEYLLPNNDRIRLIANHDQKTVQLMLFTYQAELIKLLPGKRHSSLIADLINKVQSYCIRSESYTRPLSLPQEQKLQITTECINALKPLLKEERRLSSDNYEQQETLRRKAISIIKQHHDKNRMLANNPLISEGSLGDSLFDAYKIAQNYSFSRIHSVSRQDQMDFSKIKKANTENPCFIWDSELHIGHNKRDLDDALRVICHYYGIPPAPSLNNVPANRLEKIHSFFYKMWHDGHDWIKHLASENKPEHKIEEEQPRQGISLIQITPYYKLQGLDQKAYPSINQLVADLMKSPYEPILATNVKQAKKILSNQGHASCAIIVQEQRILIRQENKIAELRYFQHGEHFYPLPTGQDLYTLAQVCKRHLYLPERASLQFKTFVTRIPHFFSNFYKRMHRFIIHDLKEEFINHVHASHQQKTSQERAIQPKLRSPHKNSLARILRNKGVLTNGQTLEGFIKEQIRNNPYVIAQANHPPSIPAYDNPLHRVLNIVRHIGSIFIDASERNPLIGSLAIAAYAFGGGAILAPKQLEDILIKLHLSGLISAIEPTQKLAHLLNHSTYSQAVSISTLYWQSTVVGGNMDKFFIDAFQILKEDPAQIAIIAALALSLGYGLTKAIPVLGKEMGDFPYTNYAALGGKGGAAMYDTIMHPGDDWFLGTWKWVCKSFLTLGKLFIAPFIEGFYYGFHDGFIHGWKKNVPLFQKFGKQLFAAISDLSLSLFSLVLIGIGSLFIHVPFRGITNLLTKILGTLGHIEPIGKVFRDFADRTPKPNLLARFSFLPLYGFSSPFGHFTENILINISINVGRGLFLPIVQLLKNLLILPLIDVCSLSIRLGITLLNPITRILAHSLGIVLCTFGAVWDPSVGSLFASSANGLTVLFNWMDNGISAGKQYLLSHIETQRRQLYHWAFEDAHSTFHPPLTDERYFLDKPSRYELVPHRPNSHHCLLKALLEQPKTPPPPCFEPTHYNLFSSIPPLDQSLEERASPSRSYL
ncbi:hypothetical protein J2N86_10815 [Legionella lytica]|uniref:Coiled-coil protein n=1 Tax=Legionella lytica TaxID=96232 RepID=A0ABY4Y6V3_9GAMM|nr:hypothetical protein [Legionella lytica]USQ13176.1 hypothetical protein J2N86_10815 [Legionella lytica]